MIDASTSRLAATLALVALAALATPRAATAQPLVQGMRADAILTAALLVDGVSIELDGVLDEAAWARAVPAADFIQSDPDNGMPASERTEVRVLYDSRRLLIGAVMYDSDPGGVLGNQMQRDQPFQADDRFIWTIDTFLDGRTGYYFEVNPVGAMGDGLISGAGAGGGGAAAAVAAAVAVDSAV